MQYFYFREWGFVSMREMVDTADLIALAKKTYEKHGRLYKVKSDQISYKYNPDSNYGKSGYSKSEKYRSFS